MAAGLIALIGPQLPPSCRVLSSDVKLRVLATGLSTFPDLSVVCFRHLPGGRAASLALPPGELDAHQDRLQVALEASGDGWLTTTRLRGATYLRAGIVNYLATESDIDRLLATLRRLAAE